MIETDHHSIQCLRLHPGIAVQHKKISSGAHSQGLVDSLRETSVLLIHDEMHCGIADSNGINRRVLGIVIDDDHFKPGLMRGLEHRPETVEHERSRVITDDRNGEIYGVLSHDTPTCD